MTTEEIKQKFLDKYGDDTPIKVIDSAIEIINQTNKGE